MGRKRISLILFASLLASCGATSNETASSETSASSEESVSSSYFSVEDSSSSSVEKKTLYFPTDVDDTASSSGIDVFLGYSDYRITHMYTGEGVKEEILSYRYNEEYCTIDDLGRIHPVSAGSSRCYAVTESGSYPFKVNVKEGVSFRNWIRSSAAEMKTNYANHGSKKNSYVFFGDSFFDPRGFWEEEKFYSSFSGQNVFLTGIGTAKTNDWMTIKKENLIDYQPKAIFMNLGINNIINAGDNGKTLAAKLETLFEELHYMKTDMPIYYYGIIHCGDASWNAKADISNDIVKQYAEGKDWLTYLDIPSLVNANIGSYLKSDSLHPNDACYEKFVSLAKEHM